MYNYHRFHYSRMRGHNGQPNTWRANRGAEANYILFQKDFLRSSAASDLTDNSCLYVSGSTGYTYMTVEGYGKYTTRRMDFNFNDSEPLSYTTIRLGAKVKHFLRQSKINPWTIAVRYRG